MAISTRHLRTIRSGCVLAAGLALAAAAAAHGQTVAQTTAGEVVVTAPYPAGPNVRSLSRPVSYRDLDLTTEAGRSALSDRVRTTARDLCSQLGEPKTPEPPAPSCEQAAVDGTAEQQRTAIAQATPKP
jgi:UrcA family protein